MPGRSDTIEGLLQQMDSPKTRNFMQPHSTNHGPKHEPVADRDPFAGTEFGEGYDVPAWFKASPLYLRLIREQGEGIDHVIHHDEETDAIHMLAVHKPSPDVVVISHTSLPQGYLVVPQRSEEGMPEYMVHNPSLDLKKGDPTPRFRRELKQWDTYAIAFKQGEDGEYKTSAVANYDGEGYVISQDRFTMDQALQQAAKIDAKTIHNATHTLQESTYKHWMNPVYQKEMKDNSDGLIAGGLAIAVLGAYLLGRFMNKKR